MAREMLQEQATPVSAVAFDHCQGVTDYRVRVGPKAALVLGDDRAFRIDVQIDQRREIEVEAAGGQGGGGTLSVTAGQLRVIHLAQVLR